MKYQNKIIKVVPLLFIFTCINSFAKPDEKEAQTLDRLIEHQSERMDIYRNAKRSAVDDEMNKFFDEMQAEEARDLKRLEEMRTKFFPTVKKTPSTKEKMAEFSGKVQDEFKTLEADMKRAIERFNTKIHNEKFVSTFPRVEIQENNNGYDIKAEVPGMSKEDVKVNVNNQDLTITGTRKSEVSRSTANSSSSEFHYGKFERTIHLEDKIDPKSMKIEYKDGILNVHLNKASETKTHKA